MVRSRQQASRAAEAAVQARQELQSYLRITAPFDRIVTDRLVHPGALAEGSLQEVLADLNPGHLVVRRATEELREGTPLPAGGSK